MLKQLRSQRTMKTVMWVMAGVFVIGFLFLGQGLNVGSGGGGQTQGNLAAVVNGVKVPYETYNNRVTQLAEGERARSSRDDLSSADYERLESQAYQGLVTEVLVRQEAQRLGLRADDNEIVAYLENNPPPFVRQSFTDEQGNFDAQAFRHALDDPNTDWRAAEAYVRDLLPTLKLQQMVTAGVTVSEVEVREEFVRRTLRSTVRYIGKRWSDIPQDTATPSDEELRRFHQEHPELFSQGEQVRVEALRVAKKASAEDQDELRRDAAKILDELHRGVTTDFAALAGIYSEDPSASQGGSMGWVRRGFLPAVVDEAVWELPVGGRTAPLLAERGLYIVQVDSSRTAADGQHELYLRQLFLQLKASATTEDSLRTFAFQLADAARKDFAGTAQKYGLTPEKLEPITASTFISGFGFSQRLHDWAFAASPNDVGGPFGNDEAILVLRVLGKDPPGLEDFETVRPRVQSGFLEQKRKDAVRAILTAVTQEMAAGRTLDEAARNHGLEVKTPEPFTFYESVPDVGGANEFTAVATALEPGKTSGVVETTTGAFIVQLVRRDPFDEAKYQGAREMHFRTLFDRQVSMLLQSWVENLQKAAKIQDRRGPRV